jgi:hypothetical protein
MNFAADETWSGWILIKKIAMETRYISQRMAKSNKRLRCSDVFAH